MPQLKAVKQRLLHEEYRMVEGVVSGCRVPLGTAARMADQMYDIARNQLSGSVLARDVRTQSYYCVAVHGGASIGNVVRA